MEVTAIYLHTYCSFIENTQQAARNYKICKGAEKFDSECKQSVEANRDCPNITAIRSRLAMINMLKKVAKRVENMYEKMGEFLQTHVNYRKQENSIIEHDVTTYRGNDLIEDGTVENKKLKIKAKRGMKI